jgi:hypothetical protein
LHGENPYFAKVLCNCHREWQPVRRYVLRTTGVKGIGMRQQVSHQDRLFGYDAAELFTMLIGIALLTVLAMIF